MIITPEGSHVFQMSIFFAGEHFRRSEHLEYAPSLTAVAQRYDAPSTFASLGRYRASAPSNSDCGLPSTFRYAGASAPITAKSQERRADQANKEQDQSYCHSSRVS